jgi:phosphate-selective porin OprO/OprP
MKRSKRMARHALMGALGVAFTTLSTFTGTTLAEGTGFKFYSSNAQDQVALLPAFMQNPSDIADGVQGLSDLEEVKEADLEDASVAKDSEEGDAASDLSLLSEEFDKLKEQLEEMEESIEKVADTAGNKSIVVSGTKKSTMKVSGRVHLDAWGFDHDDSLNQSVSSDSNGEMDGAPDDEPNRFEFRRLRFGVKGKIKDNMVYKIEMEFGGGNDSEFRDAYLGWSDLPILQKVLLGNQKRPFGLDHLNSSRFNVFLERPFVIEAFNEDARRVGIQSYGISDDLDWNWRYGVFNQRNIQDEGEYVGDHLQLQVAGRLANTFWYDEVSGGRGYGHWAVSGAHADVSTDDLSEARFRTRPEARTTGARYLNTGQIDGADFYNLIGLEGVVNVGALQVVGEYQSNWVERNGFNDVRLDGGYVYASFFLTGEHIPWDRESGTIGRIKPFQNFWMVDKCDGCREAGWGAFQVAARYSQGDFSDEDIFGGEGEALTIGLNWYWNENARVQVNYIAGDVQNSTVGNRGAAPIQGDYDIWGARFMVDF